MSSTPSASEPLHTHLEIPDERWLSWPLWVVAGLALAAAGVGVAWKTGLINPSRLWTRPAEALATLPVDEGAIYVVVTEYGSLESSNNATIRCKVEALIGQVGGAGQQGGGRAGGAGGQGGRGGGAGQAGQGGQQPQQQQPAAAKKKSQTSGTAATKSAASGSGSGSALVTGGQAGAAGANGGSAAGGAAASGSSAASAAAAPMAGAVKPVIRSFTYTVAPYVSLRPKVQAAPQQPVKPVLDPSMAGGGGGGGGRRGGGGGGGGNANNQEKPGSTRILSILPEGTRVKPGEVVCELDSSAFRDELQAQQIRWAQARALVEQAQAILDVNEITLREYRDGIYPQDVQLVRQYLATCDVEADRAKKNLVWSKQTYAKGFRTPAQVKADTSSYEQAETAQREARGMITRLEKYTGPRLTKHLMAKIEAIKADKLAQEAVYQLETDRRRRLEETVANCTLRAPRDGIVVYANQANRWGMTQNPIQEGVTVRQGQALINLPDPNHMQVRAQINESKVSSIHAGQKARIRVDAFPDRPLTGTVGGVTPIPAPSGGMGQDVRVYYATVEIDSGGFDALRPGLSAAVTFLVDAPQTVTRVPLQSVRWVKDTPFAAVVALTPPGGGSAERPAYAWRRLTLGRSDVSHIEVVSGLRPGDRVAARPDHLPAPSPSAPAVAEVKAHDGPRG